jgi:phosphopantothenoylcysteine decarboxylase/phosphopantothenate--cysteine ligase
VALGRWADLMIIAPLSCNTLAKMATGMCDNLLLAVYLSATCPVMVAPAMDEDMWKHPSTKRNINRLNEFGNLIMPVTAGELASGLIGEGRMSEPEDILSFVQQFFLTQTDFKGKKILITAGPTFEAIDPVRFIGNHSSGKMGVAIAEEFAKRGAAVELVLGPSSQQVSWPGITITHVTSAEEMFNACDVLFPSCQVAVMSAAVADYTPVVVAKDKLKKNDNELTIELRRTKDILAHLGTLKNNDQVLVGFALETQNEKAYALKKLEAKNADLIVLNSLNDQGAGFGKDTNKITIFDKNKQEYSFPVKSKKEVAKDIVDTIKHVVNG